MALIPKFYLDSVVAIGTLNEHSEVVWIGTGFLFGKLIEPVMEEKLYNVYLVTNKHVLTGLNSIILRFNPNNDQAATDFNESPVNLNGKQNWTGHPNPNVDVAVMSINVELLKQKDLKYGFFSSDDHTLMAAQMRDQDILEGDYVYVLGFPMQLVGKDRQHVILRQGVISRVRDLYESRSSGFIVDAIVFPGNSGGPVVSKPELVSIEGTKSQEKANLIGVIKSYIPYQDVAISQQTGRPRITFEENSGLSLVEPVDYIMEAIAEDMKTKNIA